MIEIARCSVASYGGRDARMFDYLLPHNHQASVGSVIRVSFRRKMSLAVIKKILPKNQASVSNLLPTEQILDLLPLPKKYLTLVDWIGSYYCASSKAIWSNALPSGLNAKLRKQIPVVDHKPNTILPFRLSATQSKVFKDIKSSEHLFHLIHGVTGSGKTEIYLSLIAQTLNKGQSILFLVPEIVLTPQIIDRVRAVFGNRVLAYHSKLTTAHRKAVWKQVLEANTPIVVIAARSGLFLPFNNLGLIVLDEEHEPSYKQTSAPRYHARDTAAKLAHLHQAKLVMGSATPSVVTYFLCSKQKVILHNLHERYGKATLPKVQIVNLAHKIDYLSTQLRRAIQVTLDDGKQVLLFLNRRGSASVLLCNDCGYVFKCPHCDTSLTFHADLGKLLCHYCGWRQNPAAICPNCDSSELKFIGAGTKKIEDQITSQFNKYKIARLDSDNASYENITQTLDDIRRKKIDILIGTQIISRGLDFENIGLVGVLLADSTLNIADFGSSERAFCLLTQVAGRAGRHHQSSQAIIQTLTPDNYAIVTASANDYDGFYTHEIKARSRSVYPPYCYLLKLDYVHKNKARAWQVVKDKANQLESAYAKHITILGPVEAYIKRIRGKAQINLIIKSKDRSTLNKIAQELDVDWSIDLDPISLL